MPKRPAAPTPPPAAVVETRVDPLLKAGDTFVLEVDKWRTLPPMLAAPEGVRQQLTDLAELISNARAVRDTGFLADAQKRIATLRSTLGL